MQTDRQFVRRANFYPQFNDNSASFFQPQPEHGSKHIEKRKNRRYRICGHLLSVCDYYAGQILDISRTGLSCQIVHFLTKANDKICHIKPFRSDKIDILSPGLAGYFFRSLPVREVWDLNLGQLYQENKEIIAYRRSILLASPLREDQFASLKYYLADDLRAGGSMPPELFK